MGGYITHLGGLGMARLTKEQLQKEVELLRKENARLRAEIQGIRDGLRSIRVPVDEGKPKFNFYVLAAVLACIFFLALFLFTPKQDKAPSTATKVVLASTVLPDPETLEKQRKELERQKMLTAIRDTLDNLLHYPTCDYKFRDGIGYVIYTAKKANLSMQEYQKLDNYLLLLQEGKNCPQHLVKSFFTKK